VRRGWTMLNRVRKEKEEDDGGTPGSDPIVRSVAELVDRIGGKQTLHQHVPERVRSSSDSGGVLCVREEGSARYVRMVLMDRSKQIVRVEPSFIFFSVFMPSLTGSRTSLPCTANLRM
jgi:hypothetical protein